jgi:hypothetical protein
MPSDWKIKKGDVDGGPSGQLLIGCEIRINEDNTGYEFVAVLAKTDGKELPPGSFEFPPFAYRGFIWTIQVDEFVDDNKQAVGGWGNNARVGGPPADESGTYTAQSGPGTLEEGKEDAASASA